MLHFTFESAGLRHREKRYKKRLNGKKAGRGCIPNRVDISERPKIVEEKSRIGDWEADTIILKVGIEIGNMASGVGLKKIFKSVYPTQFTDSVNEDVNTRCTLRKEPAEVFARVNQLLRGDVRIYPFPMLAD